MTAAYNPENDPNAAPLEQRLPRLAGKVCALWGTRDFEPFVSNIIMDTRDGTRQGLPWDAAQDLLFLLELAVAKRALIAADATGQPFRQVFRQMMTNAEAAARSLPRTGWGDPMSNAENSRDMRISDSESGYSRNAASTRRKPKKGFFARLFGR